MSTTLDLSTNPNTHWAAVFMNELALAGLEHLCFAPGSRSTPLVLAAAQTPGIRLHRHLDERSAGFFALGLAKASRRPVALVCTSGTAVANFHPAVIEAYQSRVPLIVLSADRPPELRHSGANQTIDQLKLFGDHVRLFMELPVPQNDAPSVTVRHLRTSAARAYATAQAPVAGPVHLNFPFRKPLEPSASGVDSTVSSGLPLTYAAQPYTTVAFGRRTATESHIEWLADLIAAEPHGLIICGPNCPADLVPAVAALSEQSGYPIAADPLSGVRFGAHVGAAFVLGAYDLLLQAAPDAWPPIRVLLRFGDVPTSSALNAFIDRSAPEATIHIREDGVWADDLHRVRHLWAVNDSALCDAVTERLRLPGQARTGSPWARRFTALESLVWQSLDQFQDGRAPADSSAVQALLATLPSDATVFAGNSLAIRHVDSYAKPSPARITVFGNRGASGIDGNVSTAIGLAAASGRPVVAILGDLTFYHDMNGLLALRDKSLPPVTFVVLNNDGGGIFRRLPVAAHEPLFTELFLTPHGLTFEHAAALYELDYRRIDSDAGGAPLTVALARLGQSSRSTVIEVMTNGERDWETHQALIAHLQASVAAYMTTAEVTNKETTI